MKNIQRSLRLIERFFNDFIEFIKCIFIFPFAVLLSLRNDIFLISERGFDARDNGFHFFKYLRTNFPNLKVFYVIDKKSVDFKKVNVFGNIIGYRSVYHYLYFIAAKYKISTHIMGYSPNWKFYNKYQKFLKFPGKRIFLQHGIIKDDLTGLYYEKTHLDLFICGALPEYNYILSNFHYPNNIVRYTGLARFDNLNRYKTDNYILVMPTWRVYLQTQTKKGFLDSEYYKNWNSLLNNLELHEILLRNEMKLIFYPHIEMQKFIDNFSTKYENFAIVGFENSEVQELLKNAKMLITDYSSVFFDFAYMKKPIIFYQFDEKTFFRNHYSRGYFNYRNSNFGDVVTTEIELLVSVKEVIKKNFVLDDSVFSAVSSFFSIHDNNNCERIFKEILELK